MLHVIHSGHAQAGAFLWYSAVDAQRIAADSPRGMKPPSAVENSAIPNELVRTYHAEAAPATGGSGKSGPAS